MTEVRLAERQDIPALTDTLVAAFDDDPIVGWTFRPRGRARGSAHAFRRWMQQLVGQDVTWCAADGRGVAVWALPERWRRTPRQSLALMAGTTVPIGWRAPMVGWGLWGVERRHPVSPHLYLALLGVHPDAQGQGLGSALLEPGLALADAEGLPAYLETGKERNVAFYARHGFRVIEELRLPAGPPAWLLWRDARA